MHQGLTRLPTAGALLIDWIILGVIHRNSL
jgi:hypothetical protein